MSRLRHWLLPSYGTLLALAAFVYGLVLRRDQLFSWDGDVGRHLRVGLDIIEAGRIPFRDAYSHAAGPVDTYPYEWLSQVLYAAADAAGGLPGVAVLAALLFTGAVVAVHCAALELGAAPPVALVVGALGLPLQSVHLLPRPHLLTTALAGLFLIILLRFVRSRRIVDLAWLPLIMIVWANAHPGFLIGFALLGVFTVAAILGSEEFDDGRRTTRSLVVVSATCLIASLMNPAGIGPWVQAADLLGTDFILAVTHEFQSVDFHSSYGKLFLGALLAGPALWMTGRIRVTWLAAGQYLVFAAASLHSVRYAPLFAVVVLPWLAVWIEEFLEDGGEASARLLGRMRTMGNGDTAQQPWFWIAASLGLIAFVLGPARETYRFNDSFFPVAAVRTLEALDVSGPVFNQMHWGGYLLYVRPDIPIFIDGMSHIYGEGLAHEYLAAVKGQAGWRDVLDRHGIEWTLIGARQPLAQLLALDREWFPVYADAVAVVYRRQAPGSR